MSMEQIQRSVLSQLIGLGMKTVLDAGCGTGELCSLIDRSGMKVLGFDKKEAAIERARSQNPSLDFFVLDVERESWGKGTARFDAVVSTEVIEHLTKPGRLVKLAAEVLKQPGYLLVTTPYHGYCKNLLIAVFDKWDSHHDVLFERGHVKFWSVRTLGALLQQYGFEVVHWHGIGRLPYLWRSMLVVARKGRFFRDRAAAGRAETRGEGDQGSVHPALAGRQRQ